MAKARYVDILILSTALMTPSAWAARRPAQAQAQETTTEVKAPPRTEHNFFFGLGFASYTEKRNVNRTTGASVPAHVTTIGKALKLEYALRQGRRGFRAEGFYLLNRATIQSVDPTVGYLASSQDHVGMGGALGPFYHFTSLATTVGLSVPFLYRSIEVKNASSVSSLEKGTMNTYGLVLDLRWRLNSPLYFEQKIGVMSGFSGPFWSMALDYRLK